jgi:hypothetical protein
MKTVPKKRKIVPKQMQNFSHKKEKISPRKGQISPKNNVPKFTKNFTKTKNYLKLNLSL